MTQVVISLGSNIQPATHLRQAVERLRACCRVLAVSPVYETAPIGVLDQPSFLNAAVLLETNLDAATLKNDILRPIERKLGRVRTADKNAPRTIDLDITLFNDQVFDLGQRHIPDSDLLRYAHSAIPVADIVPTWRHPEDGRTLAEIASSLPATGIRPRPDIIL